jgi:hypothetical protein
MSSRPTLPSAEEIGELVPIGRIAKQTPYSADFLRQLARVGKLRAYKLHRDWLTTPDAVHDYIKSQTKRHEKALSALQAAEKAFLAVALLLVVFSVTPEARAQGLSNPPPAEGSISATLHDLAAGWQDFALFYQGGWNGLMAEQGASLRQMSGQLVFVFGTINQPFTNGWNSLVNDVGLLDEYATNNFGPSNVSYRSSPPYRTYAAVPAALGRVLGASTTVQVQAVQQPVSLSYIQHLITQTLQSMVAAGQLTGPQGQQGAQGPQGPAGASASNVVNNQNGDTTATIGGNPIVTYVPPVQENDFSGTTLSGFGQLSAGSFSSGDIAANGNLTVLGNTALAGLNVSGSVGINSLAVSGAATFSGNVTLPSSTINTLIPLTNKGDLLTYNGSAVVRFGVGSDGLCLTASSTASSGLAWQNCATASGALISLNGQSENTQTFATGTDANIALTITSMNGVHTFTPSWLGVLAASRGGIGTTTLGSLTTGPNLSVIGGQSVLIGTSTQITLSSTPTFTTVNGNTIQSGSGTLNLGSNTLTLTGNASLNQNLTTSDSPTFNGLTLSSPLAIGSGGTGLSSVPSLNGQLLMASSTGWTVGSLIAGSNITITTSTPGQITIAANGSGQRLS